MTTVLLAVLLTGCGAGISDSLCHNVVRYPPDIQQQAEAEIRSGQAPILSRFVEDYGELRARIRANCP